MADDLLLLRTGDHLLLRTGDRLILRTTAPAAGPSMLTMLGVGCAAFLMFGLRLISIFVLISSMGVG